MEKQKTTLKQIAERTGVSIGTVHRAIYGKAGVGEKTRKLILEEVERSNYSVDAVASMLKRKQPTIAVVLPEERGEDQYYFRGVWRGINEAAKRLKLYKVNFLFFEHSHSLDEIALALKELYDSEIDRIDGLITVADNLESGEWVARFSRRDIPVILISSYEQDTKCLSSIKVDHRICGQMAAEFFAVAIPSKTGKILLLSGHSEIYSNSIYASAFEGHIKNNFPAFEVVKVEGFGGARVAEKINSLLDAHQFRGVFACNARNTFLMCKAIAQRKDKNDIIFVGTDAFHELAPYFQDGTITATVYQSHREQGERAVTMMHEYLTANRFITVSDELPVTLLLKSNFHFFAS
ncbi:MAG: substrate-binding domain-containing protein [Christensenellales bacterium]|jgi:LacI family transcriptional regulator